MKIAYRFENSQIPKDFTFPRLESPPLIEDKLPEVKLMEKVPPESRNSKRRFLS